MNAPSITPESVQGIERQCADIVRLHHPNASRLVRDGDTISALDAAGRSIASANLDDSSNSLALAAKLLLGIDALPEDRPYLLRTPAPIPLDLNFSDLGDQLAEVVRSAYPDADGISWHDGVAEVLNGDTVLDAVDEGSVHTSAEMLALIGQVESGIPMKLQKES